jgi:hypothetical protein
MYVQNIFVYVLIDRQLTTINLRSVRTSTEEELQKLNNLKSQRFHGCFQYFR